MGNTLVGNFFIPSAKWPNWAVKRTSTLAMASPFSWPVLVPFALLGSGAAYLGRPREPFSPTTV